MKIAYLLFFLLIPFTWAVEINTIYYDAFNEAGSEFIILSNPSNTSVNITNWYISTPASQQDAIITGTISPLSKFLIVDQGWDAGKDNSSWPDGNHEETLTLGNTAGYVKLHNAEGTTIDLIGYGNTNVSNGEPHAGSQEGEALVRVNNTNDNSADFIARQPIFTTTTNDSNPIEITVEINNTPISIISVTTIDESDDEGIQILPFPGSRRDVPLTITLEDLNGFSFGELYVNGKEILFTGNASQTTINTTFPLYTNTTQIHVVAHDEEHSDEYTLPLELLAVTGIAFPLVIDLKALPGARVNTTLPILNTGTTNVSLHLKGNNPSLGEQLMGDISYTLAGSTNILSQTFRAHNIQLAPQKTVEIGLEITTGYVPAGWYSGQIIVAAVPQ